MKTQRKIMKIVLCVIMLVSVPILLKAQCGTPPDYWCDWGQQVEICSDYEGVSMNHIGHDAWIRTNDTLVFHSLVYIVPYAGLSFCISEVGDTLARVCAMESYDPNVHYVPGTYQCAGMSECDYK